MKTVRSADRQERPVRTPVPGIERAGVDIDTAADVVEARASPVSVRYVLVIVLIAVAAWVAWGRPISGPLEAVVTRFLRAAHDGDRGTAQSYMTQHMRGRIGQEGFGAMQRFVEARLEPFATYEIARVTPRGDEVDVVVRLLLPIPAEASPPRAQEVAAHGYPGRIDGNQFVHAHRFQLQREDRAWRIYQFEEVDERI